MTRFIYIGMCFILAVTANMRVMAQVETEDALANDDATWSQAKVVSADYGLSTDLNGKSSITYKLVDATGAPDYTEDYYSYDIIMELVHSDGTKVDIEYYHYDNTMGWSKKNTASASWSTPNGSITTSGSVRGTIEGTVHFNYGQNGDKIRLTIANSGGYTRGFNKESYFTVFEVRTIRYDLYDDRELLGNAANQNNFSEHTTPISVYVHRNLNAANWSTLCLPFDIPYENIEKVFGTGTIVSKFANVDLAGNIINFYTAPVRSEGIKAGQPYLIKPGKNFTADNPFFVTNVTTSQSVTATETTDTNGYGYAFTGILQPTVIRDAVSSTQVPVYISDNHLYKDKGTVPMKGFRAYFKFPSAYPDGTSTTPAKNMLLSIENDMVTAVDKITADGVSTKTDIYNLNGQRIAPYSKTLPKGIYIVGGRKVMIK